jgi:hypothetical protein
MAIEAWKCVEEFPIVRWGSGPLDNVKAQSLCFDVASGKTDLLSWKYSSNTCDDEAVAFAAIVAGLTLDSSILQCAAYVARSRFIDPTEIKERIADAVAVLSTVSALTKDSRKDIDVDRSHTIRILSQILETSKPRRQKPIKLSSKAAREILKGQADSFDDTEFGFLIPTKMDLELAVHRLPPRVATLLSGIPFVNSLTIDFADTFGDLTTAEALQHAVETMASTGLLLQNWSESVTMLDIGVLTLGILPSNVLCRANPDWFETLPNLEIFKPRRMQVSPECWETLCGCRGMKTIWAERCTATDKVFRWMSGRSDVRLIFEQCSGVSLSKARAFKKEHPDSFVRVDDQVL